MEKKYYIAYGSNLNLEQMRWRCPDAKLIGTGLLPNQKLVFRGGKNSAVATVEPSVGDKVPVGIFEISSFDEQSLDRYEGFPHLYTKKYLNIESETVHQQQAMMYVMNDGYKIGLPSHQYLKTIEQGYKDCQLDRKYLDEAVEEMKTIIKEMEMKDKYPLGYKDVRP